MKLHVEEFGAPSNDTVVLLHGALTSPSYMDLLGLPLAKSRRVLRFDMPGYGESPAISPYSIDAIVSAIETALLERGVRQTAIVGSSAGSYRALQLAISGRIELTHLITMGGHANLSPEARVGLHGLAASLRTGQDLSVALTGVMFAPEFVQTRSEAMATTVKWMNSVSRTDLADELDAYAEGPDLTGPLGHVRLPILAIVGERDAAAPPALSREIVAAARNARLEVLANRGHALLHEDLSGTLALVEAFLEDR